MFKEKVDTSKSPQITLTECLGDLVVKGEEGEQVTIRLRGQEDDLALKQDGDGLIISARSDCYLTCPAGSTVEIGVVRGDLKIKGMEGPVAAGTVNGDVILRIVGPTALEQVSGDLSARQVGGDLSAQSLAGDARVREVAGGLHLGQVGGDLRAEGVEGGLEVEGVGAEVRLGPPFTPGATYRLRAGSGLRVYLPVDASLRFTLQAGGRIRSDIPDLQLEETDEGTTGTIGDGGAALEATVGGHIRLLASDQAGEAPEDLALDFVADLEGLGMAIESRITEAMAEMESRLAASVGHLDSDAFRFRIEKATERASRAAERAAEKARRAAEREAEQARLRAERAERRWQRASGKKPRSQPKKPTVSDEERMRVLRMVEEGKVTPEQAADLLAALEGR